MQCRCSVGSIGASISCFNIDRSALVICKHTAHVHSCSIDSTSHLLIHTVHTHAPAAPPVSLGHLSCSAAPRSRQVRFLRASAIPCSPRGPPLLSFSPRGPPLPHEALPCSAPYSRFFLAFSAASLTSLARSSTTLPASRATLFRPSPTSLRRVGTRRQVSECTCTASVEQNVRPGVVMHGPYARCRWQGRGKGQGGQLFVTAVEALRSRLAARDVGLLITPAPPVGGLSATKRAGATTSPTCPRVGRRRRRPTPRTAGCSRRSPGRCRPASVGGGDRGRGRTEVACEPAD